MLVENGVFRVVGVHLIVHLHAEAGVTQRSSRLVHRSADQVRDLNGPQLRWCDRLIVDANRVNELDDQVAEHN